MQQRVARARGSDVHLDHRPHGGQQAVALLNVDGRFQCEVDQVRDAQEDAIEVLLLLVVDRAQLQQLAGFCVEGQM